jgi:hypothetical protein
MCAMLGCASHNSSSSTPVAPATMPRIATVDERYQSYNVEMLEVTGGISGSPMARKPIRCRRQDACRSYSEGKEGASMSDVMSAGVYKNHRLDLPVCKSRLPWKFCGL